MVASTQQFPQAPTSKLVSQDGKVTPAWQAFFSSLWSRTGGPQGEVTLVLDSLGNPTTGATLFRGPSVWQILPVGTNGQLYTVSPGLLPHWESISAWLDRIVGSAPGLVLNRDVSAWVGLGISAIFNRDFGNVAGDILYQAGLNWQALGIGAPGQLLTVVAGLPTWQTYAPSTLTFNNIVLTPTVYASLPASPAVGTLAMITDSTTNVWGTAAAGGGLDTALVCFIDGQWVVTSALLSTEFNPATLNVTDTLTNNNLTWHDLNPTNSTSNYDGVLSFRAHSAGKYYVEVTVNTIGTEYAVGFGNVSAIVNASPTWLGSTLNGVGWWIDVGDGGVYCGSGSALATIATVAAGNVARVAIDLDHKMFWGALNGGNWNLNPAANPATNTGGINIGTVNAGPYYFILDGRQNTLVMTADFGASAFAFTPPAGFVNW